MTTEHPPWALWCYACGAVRPSGTDDVARFVASAFPLCCGRTVRLEFLPQHSAQPLGPRACGRAGGLPLGPDTASLRAGKAPPPDADSAGPAPT